ncbi:DUF4956 domain-containing protein [bacterium SCSIO 12741]|nr:DUF4956 domain-containing protein [bacterium SCSIO 12741]
MTLLLDIFMDGDKPRRFFGIKLYDVDFIELCLRLGLNLLTAYIVIWLMYQPTRKNSEYLFTYLVMSPLVFFICHLFATTDLSIGFAFGLFAVFSILRYRTTTIPVKEMTYMFIIISIAVINAISTKKVSYIELMFTNVFIVFLTYFMEKLVNKGGIQTQIMIYENVENLLPENEHLLREDIQKRTGKEVIRFEILESDYLKDTARLRIFFKNGRSQS